MVNFGFSHEILGDQKYKSKDSMSLAVQLGYETAMYGKKMEWYLNKPMARDLFLWSVLHRYFLMNHQWMI